MATKSKNSKPFRAWLGFFIGLNIIAIIISLGLVYFDEIEWAMLGSDFQETRDFKYKMAHKFDILSRYITGNLFDDYYTYDPESGLDRKEWEEQAVEDFLGGFTAEEDNLIYYAKNPNTGLAFTNAKGALSIGKVTEPTLPKGYNYYLLFDGEGFRAQKDGKPIDMYDPENDYRLTVLFDYLKDINEKPIPSLPGKQDIEEAEDNEGYKWQKAIEGSHIFLGVKEKPERTSYGSGLYNIQTDMKTYKWFVGGILAVFLLGLILFIYSIRNRDEKRKLEERIGRLLGSILLEFKVLANFLSLIFGINILGGFYWNDIVEALIMIFGGFWWVYLLWIDLRTNGSEFFKHNLINSLIRAYRKYEMRKPLEKGLILRTYTIIGVAVLGTLFTLVPFMIYSGGGSGRYLFAAIIVLVLSAYLLHRYLKRHRGSVSDIGEIMDQAHRIREGDHETKLSLSPYGDFYFLGENLNAIQEGIANAVEKSLKSERMKVELITNVSHDLKTPLTSIISYADLLSKEEDLPDHVKDYIKILSQKSMRLKLLIQDLFDLSKVVSGEVEMNMEVIDLGKLIRQTLGDMEDDIGDSGLIIRANTPEEPVPIVSDGNKLYRVFQNLIQNTLKYSMIGTRVYIDLIIRGEKAIATIKNTANYEMNFSEEEIVERFVRGDKARSGEGSGLGLAIAQNFTIACGGDFRIDVDGDLFKVILTFELN